MKAEILPLHVINDQLVTFFVPSECLSAKICCSWSSDKFAKRATYEFFSALFLLLVGSGPKISKRRKTALQPNRMETLKPGKKKKKNVHVILFTRRRA